MPLFGTTTGTWLIVCLGFVSGFSQIQLKGPVPPSIDVRSLTMEYSRIYRILAPHRSPDMSPLTIVYYSRKNPGSYRFSLPEWGGGGAIDKNLILVPIDASPFLEQSFFQTTVHELVHITLNRAYPGLKIPRWFHEGAAMTLSGELSLQENVGISKAIFTGGLMPLSAIDSVNAFGRNRADLAYSQAHLSVLFLIDQYGFEALPEILIAARSANGFWPGMQSALGISPQEFDGLLQKYLTTKYQFAFLFADTYAYWLVIVGLFIVGFVITGKRNKRRALAMEEEEKRDASDPPFGPPQNSDSSRQP